MGGAAPGSKRRARVGRRWGEGGRRDIVEGSGDEGIFVEEPGGGDVWSEGVYGAGVSVG